VHVLVTGSDGFIGKNLIVRLNEIGVSISHYTRDNDVDELPNLIRKSNFIIHLAGENRPIDEKKFDIVNFGLTEVICEEIRSVGKPIPIIFASSSQIKIDNAYGRSKLKAETSLKNLEIDTGNPVYIYRLPGVFGKFCKPDYNSVVATFCHNISRDLPIVINNPSSTINLVYIDDVVNDFVSMIKHNGNFKKNRSIQPEYEITLDKLANQLQCFWNSRDTLISEKVGDGLIRKLYSTFVSYIPPEKFSYPLSAHSDDRGMFAEMLKTKDSGQFSFFTAKPGVLRGGHYHHTKTEKFLVLIGNAKFQFRNIISNESYEVFISSKELKVVETVPGWAHSITNIGKEEMVVMLWANEIFDSDNPDTFSYEIEAKANIV
jgi:UDP-2-acetamido-2,6-beta-L-arabino-hexul-4-ose reductase